MSVELIGPFKQLLTLSQLPIKGPLQDEQLEIIKEAGILIEDGFIKKVDSFEKLIKISSIDKPIIHELTGNYIALPGFIDSHTHICFGGSRHMDYSMRVAGKSYLEIAKSGGGIWDSVIKTRQASEEELKEKLIKRASRHLSEGVTTCEVKSGYGLTVKDELRMLEIIQQVDLVHSVDLVSTCLAAHICPREFTNGKQYLEHLVDSLFPILKNKKLTNRIDIFIEDTAFSIEDSRWYIQQAQKNGFDITIHADQFSTGGSQLACELNAISADHLEASNEKEIKMLASSEVVATVLPGASLGLGISYAPARKLLDAGCCLSIASDWNPGSAPMGDLLLQSCVLGAAEKMTIAETLAAITYRAAHALRMHDRGIIASGKKADIIAFSCDDYREIFYLQGKLKPQHIYKTGKKINS